MYAHRKRKTIGVVTVRIFEFLLFFKYITSANETM